MTREEIRLKAVAMQYNLASGGRGPEADTYQIELDLRQVVRATLEEAARAVCSMCANHYEVGRDEDGRWVHDPFGGPVPVYSDCKAGKIHDLIAAMEGE